MKLDPRAPGHVSPGHLHGKGCLSARAMDTGLSTVVWWLCSGLSFAVNLPFLAGLQGVCVWVRVLASPRHSWPGFVVRVFGFGFRGTSAIPCWSLGCVCVFGYGFWFRPANFGWGLRCVCLGLGFSCTPLFLAGVLGRVPSGARSARTPPLPGRAACCEGLCWGRRGWGFPPSPLFCFSALLAAEGGLWVLFSALPWCGSVVVAVASSGLGPLGPRSPPPLRLGFSLF